MMASISITFIVKHPPKNNLEPKALSKQKSKEERLRGCSHRENYKLIAPTPEERKKTISEYRFLPMDAPFSPLVKKKRWGFMPHLFFFYYWRRREDSNLRYRYQYTVFPGLHHKPLGHFSIV